jgi:hypothetical protein
MHVKYTIISGDGTTKTVVPYNQDRLVLCMRPVNDVAVWPGSYDDGGVGIGLYDTSALGAASPWIITLPLHGDLVRWEWSGHLNVFSFLYVYELIK